MDVNTEAIGDNHAVARPRPDDVRIPDATGPEHVLHRAVDQQSNDVPNSNTAGLDIVPQQAVGPHLDVVQVSGCASTGSVPRHVEGLQQDGVPNSNPIAEHQVVGRPSGDVSVPNVAGTKSTLRQAVQQCGEVSEDNGAQVAPPPSFSSPLDVSGRYTCSNQTLLFLLSTIVALIAILIQYKLPPHRSTGIIRPGWARYRNEGLGEQCTCRQWP